MVVNPFTQRVFIFIYYDRLTRKLPLKLQSSCTRWPSHDLLKEVLLSCPFWFLKIIPLNLPFNIKRYGCHIMKCDFPNKPSQTNLDSLVIILLDCYKSQWKWKPISFFQYSKYTLSSRCDLWLHLGFLGLDGDSGIFRTHTYIDFTGTH